MLCAIESGMLNDAPGAVAPSAATPPPLLPPPPKPTTSNQSDRSAVMRSGRVPELANSAVQAAKPQAQ